jgi:ABC-2 type transport system permease protein
MLQKLSIEWMKLKNYRTFWILGILYLVSIFGINYIVYRIQQNIYADKQAKGMAEMIIGSPPYAFPNVWQMTSYVSSFLLFLPGLLMIISVTNEYSFKTHRQNIIDGWSRREFITLKLFMAVIAAAASTLMVFFTATIFGFIEGGESFSLEKTVYLFYFFIQALSYTLVALLFSVLFKRGGLAIGIFFLYAVVLENLLAGLLNRYANYSGRYLPLESTDNLIPLPLFQQVQKQLIRTPNFTALLIVAIVYIAAYFYFITRKFKTDDL